MNALVERRNGERRGWSLPPEYPFYDSNHTLVRADRRKAAERRLKSIQIQVHSKSTPKPKLYLKLRFGDRTKELTNGINDCVIGRDRKSDLRIAGGFASRAHARIRFRDDKYVLTDMSLNGTVVIPDHDAQVHLHHEDYTLSGSGVICIGKRLKDDEKYLIHYTCEIKPDSEC